MATDFKYASQSDLKNYFNRFGDYDQKIQIFPTETSGNNHFFRDCGYVDTLFVNGSEQATAQDDFDAVNSDGKWCYSSTINDLKYQNSSYSSTTINEQVFEAGVDFATSIDRQLVNASMELDGLLAGRYPVPIPKHPQYDANSTTVSAVPEYDALIIKATCLITAANLIMGKEGITEESDGFYNKVTNMDGTGIADKLTKGEYKLAYEVDANDSKGKVRAGSGNGGSMDIVETGGAYVGEPYDNILITCTTGGAYGVAIVKVAYMGNDKIQGSETTDIKVTGGLQSIHGGWYCRFHGASMTSGDTWEIEVYSETRKISNAESGAIQLTRRGYGI